MKIGKYLIAKHELWKKKRIHKNVCGREYEGVSVCARAWGCVRVREGVYKWN